MQTKSTTDEQEGEAPSKPESSNFWLLQLDAAKKDHKHFWERGAAIEKRFKNERDNASKQRGRRLNILYSNTETLKAALYARTAKPDIRQRFTATKNELARTTGELLERCLSYCADETSHDKAFSRGVQDMTLPGRGVVWVVYEPEFAPDPQTGQETVVDQKVRDEWVYYKDFLHSPCRCWSDNWWVARRHKMTRDDLKANKFPDAMSIPLNWAPDLGGDKDKECPEDLKRAEVWEIWNRSKKERVWVVEGHPTLLRRDPDPYTLKDFYPCGEPIQAVSGNDTYVPSPWFDQYADQADDLDQITERISKLTAALKRRGIYDASIKELKRLSKAGDNEFIPADNFAAFAAAGGLKGAFQTEDLKPIADALLGLYEQKNQLVQAIYEVMGIADIMRGSSDPNETLGAQQLKAQFGSSRIKLAQKEVQRWIRDTLRIKAEIIAEHFEPQTLLAMSGMELKTDVQVAQEHAQAQMQAMQQFEMAAQQAMSQGQPPPQQPQPLPPPDVVTIDKVVALLRQDHLRGYAIDIETDSTVFEDAEAEKASRTELLTAMAGFVQQWAPVSQGSAPMTKLGFEMLEFGVRGFKSGRQLEEALEECREAMEDAMANPQPPPPDPALEVEKMKAETAKAIGEKDLKLKDADLQLKGMDVQIKQIELQNKGAEIEIEREALGLKRESMQLDFEGKKRELAHKGQQMEMDLAGKRMGLEYDSEGRRAELDHRGRMSEMDITHTAAKAKAAEKPAKSEDKPKEKAKPKTVKFERGPDGRISGATVS
jgi:hypothetical protein